jgi:hypothetical protein
MTNNWRKICEIPLLSKNELRYCTDTNKLDLQTKAIALPLNQCYLNPVADVILLKKQTIYMKTKNEIFSLMFIYFSCLKILLD